MFREYVVDPLIDRLDLNGNWPFNEVPIEDFYKELEGWNIKDDTPLTTDTTNDFTTDYAAQAAKHAIKITVSIGDLIVIYDGSK